MEKLNRNPTSKSELTEWQLRAFESYREACIQEGRFIRFRELEDFGIKFVSSYLTFSSLKILLADELKLDMPNTLKAKADDQLMNEYLKWVAISKIFFSSPSDFKARGLSSPQLYFDRFGGKEEFIRKAQEISGFDFPVQTSSREFSTKDIEDGLVSLANKLGRVPSYHEINLSSKVPHPNRVFTIYETESMYEVFEKLQPRLNFKVQRKRNHLSREPKST